MMGIECISLYNESGIFITHRKKKLEKMDDNRYKLYNFDVSAVYYGRDVPYVFFVCHFIERVPSIIYIIKNTFLDINEQWVIKTIRIKKHAHNHSLLSHLCPCDLY